MCNKSSFSKTNLVYNVSPPIVSSVFSSCARDIITRLRNYRKLAMISSTGQLYFSRPLHYCQGSEVSQSNLIRKIELTPF